MSQLAYDVHVINLTADQVRSLAVALSTAAIAADGDPAQGALRVPRVWNKVFDVVQIERVIQEWVTGEGTRDPSVVLVPRNGDAGPGTMFGSLLRLAAARAHSGDPPGIE